MIRQKAEKRSRAGNPLDKASFSGHAGVMTRLTRTEVDELTQAYFRIYLDAERASAEEMAVLTAGRSAAAAAFLNGLDQALAGDDFVDSKELAALPAFPGSYKIAYEKRFAKSLHHAWLTGVAAKLDVDWEKVDVENAAWTTTYATLFSFQAESLDAEMAALVERQQTLAALVWGGSLLFETRNSIWGLGESVKSSARFLNGFYINLMKNFGTREQIREWVPYYRRQIRETVRSVRQDRREIEKLYRSYKGAVRQFRNGKAHAAVPVPFAPGASAGWAAPFASSERSAFLS